MIGVVVLQNPMDPLKGELSPCSETFVMSKCDGNELTAVNVEKVTDMAEEEDQGPTSSPVINTEPEVSCMSVVSVMQVSYRLYPELPATISVCPCDTTF